MNKKIDIVIFGATGFTGKHIVRTISNLAKSKDRNLTWGVAGRSKEKLHDLLEECGKQLKISLNHVPIIVADLKEENSLRAMARGAKIIINCCGPFGYFGEPVVKACVEEGTHHVDVSAEVPYMEEMQLKYDKRAEEKGIFIISACAYGSIPLDLGIVFMEEMFRGTLNSVEAYSDIWEEGEVPSGSVFNYSTWESVIYTFENAEKMKEMRKKLFPKPLPDCKPELKLKLLPHKSDVAKTWIFPIDGPDGPVVQRTQRTFYEKHSKRPIQIQTYFSVKSFTALLWINLLGLLILLLCKFSAGRKLLLKYPEVFSGGVINKQTPSEEKTEKLRFGTTVYGEGWKEKLPDADHEYTTPPDSAIVAKVSGCNPGYGGSAIIVVLAAITVLTERDKMPKSGGVYSPGYAFAKTSLVEELNENGIKFEILEEKSLISK